VPFEDLSICLAAATVLEKGFFKGGNVYCKKEVAESIIKIVKKIL
jgi:hypothetical protein